MTKTIVWTMEELAEMVRQRQMNEFDANMAIDGSRGNGKSTFMFKFFSHFDKFNPKEDIVFSREDVMEGLKRKKYGCIFADEMINAGHNREFFSGDQRVLIKMFNMYRDNYNILAGCVPFFYDLDPQIRKFIKIRITVVKRGLAVIQMSKNTLYNNDPWETDINRKIESAWQNGIKAGKNPKVAYHKLTTFAGYVHFGKLGKAQERMYKEIKEEKRNVLMSSYDQDNEEHEDGDLPADIKKRLYDKLFKLLKDGKLTQEQLKGQAQTWGITERRMMQTLNYRLRDQGIKGGIINLVKQNQEETKNNNSLLNIVKNLPEI